jgi:acetyltransferase-like isoleucine patch superfamily enzyme
VVTKDVPEWAVAAGNPARVVGDRRTWKTRTKSS